MTMVSGRTNINVTSKSVLIPRRIDLLMLVKPCPLYCRGTLANTPSLSCILQLMQALVARVHFFFTPLFLSIAYALPDYTHTRGRGVTYSTTSLREKLLPNFTINILRCTRFPQEIFGYCSFPLLHSRVYTR